MIPSTLYTDREVYLNRIPYCGDSLLYYTQLDTCIEEELLKKPAIVVEKQHYLIIQIAILDVHKQEKDFYLLHLTNRVSNELSHWKYHVKSLEEFVTVLLQSKNFFEVFKQRITDGLVTRDLEGLNFLLQDRLNGRKLVRFSFLDQLLEWKSVSILDLTYLIHLLNVIDRHYLKKYVENYVKNLKKL